MSKSKHTEAQMIAALKQVEAGRKAEDVAREWGVSKHTIYAWKAKYGGMDVTEPWEVVTDLPSPVFHGDIVAGTLQALVVHLNEPIPYAGSSYADFLVIPRHLGNAFRSESGNVFCNLVSMTEAEASKGLPANPSKARGNLMLMGDVAWRSHGSGW